MKKIISIIASLAITAALIPSAFAHETEAFKITADVTPFTDETFYEYYEENIPEGYDAYMVVLGLEGLADTLSYTKTAGTNQKPKYSGTTIDTAEIVFKTNVSTDSETGDFLNDYSYILSDNFSLTPSEGFLADGWTMNYDSEFVYPKAKDTTIAEIPEYITIAYVIKEGTSATFTLDSASFIMYTWTDSNIDSQTEYSTNNSKVSMDSFTLGETKPADPVPGTVTEKTALEGSESYMTVVDDNKVTRFVAMDEKTSVAATAASVLKATYAGETKQANLYKLLGVEAGAEGDVTIGKLTVKIVLPTSVITAPTAADFEIVVE